MARSAQLAMRGFGGRVRFWGDVLSGVKYRVFEALGALLVLASLLLVLALLTYFPGDASFDTAVAAPPRNYLGYDGAVIADLFMQSVGFAAYLVPAVLLGWAFRLMLRRPVHRFARRLAMLGAALILGALACSVLQIPGGPPAGGGGAVGWALLRLISSVGLAPLALPVAMTAAALVALLLLSIIGLSPGDWRVIGGGAGRGAARRVLEAGPKAASFQTVVSRKPLAETRSDPRVTPLPTRREPKLGLMPPIAAKEAEEPESMPGRLVRFVMPRAKPAPPGKRATQEAQPVLALDGEPVLPPLNLLTKAPATRTETVDEEALSKNARMLEAVLEDFGVRGRIVQVRPGPVVTLYELEPAPGIKASRVIGLADDIARSMSAISVRVAVVPGRTVIGIELPNLKAETVYLRELLDSPAYEKHAGRLALALGKDIGGEPVIADLARMPHLLIAGTTGSGKSVGINTMILSILYRMSPDRCKFIMVDPKMLELSVYDGIPHLLAPVVTEPKKAVMALKWTVREMEGFNARLKEAAAKGESLVRKVQTGFDPETGQPVFEEEPFDASELPMIIVVVDEMADLMLVAGKEIEASVQRLAQMARAAGIHLIMATQRPSVDVITGTIKANFPP